MKKPGEDGNEVAPDQFNRVLSCLKDLTKHYEEFLAETEAFNQGQFERATAEMRKLDNIVLDGQRCVEVARGLARVEAQRSLGEASPCIEEAQFWLSQVTLAKTRFRAQQCLNEATLKIELAEFWVRRALREAQDVSKPKESPK